MTSHEHVDVGYENQISIQVTDKMVRMFAELSGDHNPIHLDDEYAKTTKFGQRIAHGMIMGALISRVLNESLGSGGVYLSQSIKFVSPVYIDDTVTVCVRVTALRKEKGLGTVETNVINQRGEMVVKGDAVIMMAPAVK